MNPGPVPDLPKLLPVALNAALEAGRGILRVYEGDCGVEFKADKSPVTRADRQAHAILQKALAPTGLPFLSEEGKDIPYEERRSWEAFWLVDPLDGTKEFLDKNGEFTVNIALVKAGKPVLGVVYAPALKVLYFAAEGIGAYKSEEPFGDFQKKLEVRREELEDWIEKAQRLKVQGSPAKGGLLRVVASRSHGSPETESFLQGLEAGYQVELVSAGSSLKFCLVAEGKADLYPRLGPTMEWDTAAGQAVVEQAGGEVYCWGMIQPLDYGKEDLRNPFFGVGGPDLVGSLARV